MRNGTQTPDLKCVRCYVELFLEEASYKNPWENQIGICLRDLTELNLPSMCHAHALVNLQFCRCVTNTRWAQQQMGFCFLKINGPRGLEMTFKYYLNQAGIRPLSVAGRGSDAGLFRPLSGRLRQIVRKLSPDRWYRTENWILGLSNTNKG